MSIQTTYTVRRDWAIRRIREIAWLVREKDYKAVDDRTFEQDEDLQAFMDTPLDFEPGAVCRWTNEMLEDRLDQPFWRSSMFHNYAVTD
jgi:hypothetical protein